MRRGDESQRVRRSVCGQNKMCPVLKGLFKLPIWAGTVVGSIPLHKHTSPLLRLHKQVCTHTTSSFQLISEPQEGKQHRNTHFLFSFLPTSGICTVYCKI